MNERLACERCGSLNSLAAVPAMTQYHWDGHGEDPNRDVYLCKDCEHDHRAYWTERWSEYWSSQGAHHSASETK